MKTFIVDDFFPKLPDVSNIKLYDSSKLYEIQQNKKGKYNWPGIRSEDLSIVKPDLLNYFVETFNKKINLFPRFRASVVIHLKVKKDNVIDEIHTDEDADYSLVLNLSKTNLKSGTILYDKDDNIITESKFVQNRAILIDSRYRHMATTNYGNNIDDGRLTLNAFFKL